MTSMTYTTTIKFHIGDCAFCDDCEVAARDILDHSDAAQATVSTITADNKSHSVTVRRDPEEETP